MNTKNFQKIVSKLTFTHFYDELINGFNLKDMQEKLDIDTVGYDIYFEIPAASDLEEYDPDQFIATIKEKFNDFLFEYFNAMDPEFEREDLQYLTITFYCKKYGTTWTQKMRDTYKEFIDNRLKELNEDDGFVEV